MWWKTPEIILKNFDILKLRSAVSKDPLTEEEDDRITEYFCDYLSLIYEEVDLDFDYADDIFQLQNFVPSFYNKEVSHNRWIKVPTENGFNVYYAKGSKKYMSLEVIERQLERLHSKNCRKSSRLNKKYKDKDLTLFEIHEALGKSKAMKEEFANEKFLRDQQIVATLLKEFPLDLQYVKIQKTKTTFEYLLPYQYEVVDDESIMMYMECIEDPMNNESVKYKAFFDQDDEDKIFYMTTRGIPRDKAIMMAKLESCRFEINMKAALCEAYQGVNVKLKKVS